jgi:hypothetical protein
MQQDIADGIPKLGRSGIPNANDFMALANEVISQHRDLSRFACTVDPIQCDKHATNPLILVTS